MKKLDSYLEKLYEEDIEQKLAGEHHRVVQIA